MALLPPDPDDRLASARGCLNGLVIAGLFWLVVVALVIWWVSRP